MGAAATTADASPEPWPAAADSPAAPMLSFLQVASYFLLAVAVMSIPQLSAANGIEPVVALSAVSVKLQ